MITLAGQSNIKFLQVNQTTVSITTNNLRPSAPTVIFPTDNAWTETKFEVDGTFVYPYLVVSTEILSTDVTTLKQLSQWLTCFYVLTYSLGL